MAEPIFDIKHEGAGFSAGISGLTRVARAAVRQLVAAPVGSATQASVRTMNSQRRPIRQQKTVSSRAESSALRIVYESPLDDIGVCEFMHELDTLRKRMNREAASSAYSESDRNGESHIGAPVDLARHGADGHDRPPTVDEALVRAVRLLSQSRPMLE